MSIYGNVLRTVLVGCMSIAGSSAFAATIDIVIDECPVSADIGVDGVDTLDTICGVFGEDSKSFSGALGGNGEPFVLDVGDGDSVEFNLSFLGNTDPFIAYALGVTNNSSSTQTFTLILSSPYVGGPYNTLSASMSSSVTSLRDGIVQTFPAAGESFVSTSILDGSDILAASVGAGCNLTGLTPLTSTSCESTPTASTGVTSLASGTFGVRVHFTLSPRDVLSLNGVVSLDNVAVPAPGVLALLGLGLAGAGLLSRRRAA